MAQVFTPLSEAGDHLLRTMQIVAILKLYFRRAAKLKQKTQKADNFSSFDSIAPTDRRIIIAYIHLSYGRAIIVDFSQRRSAKA